MIRSVTSSLLMILFLLQENVCWWSKLADNSRFVSLLLLLDLLYNCSTAASKHTFVLSEAIINFFQLTVANYCLFSIVVKTYVVILFAERLKEYFKVFGEVADSIVMKDPITKRSR